MTPRTVSPLLAGLLLLAAGFTLAARPSAAAWPHDPRVNVPVSVSNSWRQHVATCSDGAGGMYLAWEDPRSGTHRIYAQRLRADGTIAPGWTASGIQLRTASPTALEHQPMVCPDGSGGLFVVWYEDFSASDTDVYAQHVSASGALLWGTSALTVCYVGGFQTQPVAAPDGAGGLFVAWCDRRSGADFDIYGQHLTSSGGLAAGSWVVGGIALCTEARDQYAPRIVADGAGGADLAWIDERLFPSYEVEVLRITSAGAVVTGWTAGGLGLTGGVPAIYNLRLAPNDAGGGIVVWTDNRSGNYDIYGASQGGDAFPRGFLGGTPICTHSSEQYYFEITPDGQGGVFVGWSDDRNGSSDVFLQRLNGTGFLAPGWPDATSGVSVCLADGTQYTPGLVADGSGGVVMAWGDERAIRQDMYAAHIGPNTYLAEGWPWNGTVVSNADMEQAGPQMVSDGAGGAIVAWLDVRNGYFYDLYAQRVERFGQLGDPQPSIVKARDVPNDQGGQLRVSWNASFVDAYPDFDVQSYRLWRQVPAKTALSAIAAGARLLGTETEGTDPPPAGTKLYRATTIEAATWYWELADEQLANGYPSYSLTAETLSDSIGGSNPYTVFMVEARGSGHIHWDSAPDSGYSVDNLPPVPPAPFTGAYAAGATHLHWGANAEADLAGYRLYRGASAGFVPGPASLVAEPPDTGYVDGGPAGRWYKLTAVDAHGNESLVAVLGPGGTVDAPLADLPAEPGLAGVSPNPFHDATAVRFALPREARVTLAVFDAAGRRVRTLADGTFAAGEHAARWDGRDESGGTVSSGLYFVRFEAEGRRFHSRVMAIR